MSLSLSMAISLSVPRYLESLLETDRDHLLLRFCSLERLLRQNHGLPLSCRSTWQSRCTVRTVESWEDFNCGLRSNHKHHVVVSRMVDPHKPHLGAPFPALTGTQL